MHDLRVLLGFTVSIYKLVLLKSIGSIVVAGASFYRSTQPMYYQMSTRPGNLHNSTTLNLRVAMVS